MLNNLCDPYCKVQRANCTNDQSSLFIYSRSCRCEFEKAERSHACGAPKSEILMSVVRVESIPLPCSLYVPPFCNPGHDRSLSCTPCSGDQFEMPNPTWAAALLRAVCGFEPNRVVFFVYSTTRLGCGELLSSLAPLTFSVPDLAPREVRFSSGYKGAASPFNEM